jgi:hypothetical protein
MTRYWEPGDDHPSIEGLKDWVSENVIAAQHDLIDEGRAWFRLRDGRLKFEFVSHEMPPEDGKPIDLWHKCFDAIEMLEEEPAFYTPYSECSDGQKKYLEDFARSIDEFADAFRKITGLPPRGN